MMEMMMHEFRDGYAKRRQKKYVRVQNDIKAWKN